MLTIIQEIIFKSVGRKDITLDTDFIKDLKLNSFDIVNITADFENRFNIRIPTKDLWKIRTVRDVIDYLTAMGIKE